MRDQFIFSPPMEFVFRQLRFVLPIMPRPHDERSGLSFSQSETVVVSPLSVCMYIKCFNLYV
jgi:hypothetical protein